MVAAFMLNLGKQFDRGPADFRSRLVTTDVAVTSVKVVVPTSRRDLAGPGLSCGSERPGSKSVPGRITGRGHRRPRLYREAIVTMLSAGFKYPGGNGGSAPILQPDPTCDQSDNDT
jgi:hypothetical protein